MVVIQFKVSLILAPVWSDSFNLNHRPLMRSLSSSCGIINSSLKRARLLFIDTISFVRFSRELYRLGRNFYPFAPLLKPVY